MRDELQLRQVVPQRVQPTQRAHPPGPAMDHGQSRAARGSTNQARGVGEPCLQALETQQPGRPRVQPADDLQPGGPLQGRDRPAVRPVQGPYRAVHDLGRESTVRASLDQADRRTTPVLGACR